MAQRSEVRHDDTSSLIRKVGDAVKLQEKNAAEITREIDHALGAQLHETYDDLVGVLSVLKASFPRRDRKRTETPLEFVRAVYFDSFGPMPMPKLDKEIDETDVPGNSATLFISEVWKSAMPHLETKLCVDIQKYGTRDPEKRRQPASITGDFGRTMKTTLKRWHGKPPPLEAVFGLVGDVAIWSGGDE